MQRGRPHALWRRPQHWRGVTRGSGAAGFDVLAGGLLQDEDYVMSVGTAACGR